ncbi:MAG: PilZ domain-containing protein [Candidatus Omnitrophica bacterium]|nr:PilZ domain-containing protein [Candidatus Omnitrophota bacterium]
MTGDNMISPGMVQERRKDPRLENNIPVKISQEGGDIVTETKNISRSGAYCCVNQYIEPMTKLMVHLLLSFSKAGKTVTKKISCEGVIVRTEPAADDGKYHIAIFFSDIKKRDAESVTDYVDTYLSKKETV